MNILSALLHATAMLPEIIVINFYNSPELKTWYNTEMTQQYSQESINLCPSPCGNPNVTQLEFILDESAIDPQAPVYSNWESLYADLIQSVGLKLVFVVGTGTMTPGMWDLSNTQFLSLSIANQAILILADGAQASSPPRGFGSALIVLFQGSVPFLFNDSYTGIILLDKGARLLTDSNTAPFSISTGAGFGMFFVLEIGSTIGQGGGTEPGSPGEPLVRTEDSAQSTVGLFGNIASITDSTFSSDATGVTQLLIGTVSPITFGILNPDINGPFQTVLFPRATLLGYDPADPADWAVPPPTTIAEAVDRLAAANPGA